MSRIKNSKLSEEHKIKIGLANKGKKRTPEEKKRISVSLIGRKLSEEHKKKLKKKKHSEETKEKIRQSNLEIYRNGRKSAMWGKKHSEETKRKMSIASKGKPKSEQAKMNMKGKKLSEEHRKKLSEIHKGEKNHQWKGGLTLENDKIRNSLDTKLWREAIFQKNHYICQCCGDDTGGNLQSHHILNFSSNPELRFAIDNGITLCEKCHKEFHKKYGIKNNTKEQIDEFLNKKL